MIAPFCRSSRPKTAISSNSWRMPDWLSERCSEQRFAAACGLQKLLPTSVVLPVSGISCSVRLRVPTSVPGNLSFLVRGIAEISRTTRDACSFCGRLTGWCAGCCCSPLRCLGRRRRMTGAAIPSPGVFVRYVVIERGPDIGYMHMPIAIPASDPRPRPGRSVESRHRQRLERSPLRVLR